MLRWTSPACEIWMMGKGSQGYRPPGRTAEAAKKRRKSADLQGFFLLKEAFNRTGSFSALLWFWVARSGTDTYVYFSACQSTQNICHCRPSPGLTWGCIDDHLLSTRESIHHLSVSRPRIALTHPRCSAHVSLSRLILFGLVWFLFWSILAWLYIVQHLRNIRKQMITSPPPPSPFIYINYPRGLIYSARAPSGNPCWVSPGNNP